MSLWFPVEDGMYIGLLPRRVRGVRLRRYRCDGPERGELELMRTHVALRPLQFRLKARTLAEGLRKAGQIRLNRGCLQLVVAGESCVTRQFATDQRDGRASLACMRYRRPSPLDQRLHYLVLWQRLCVGKESTLDWPKISLDNEPSVALWWQQGIRLDASHDQLRIPCLFDRWLNSSTAVEIRSRTCPYSWPPGPHSLLRAGRVSASSKDQT
jgi:hypothetical protein